MFVFAGVPVSAFGHIVVLAGLRLLLPELLVSRRLVLRLLLAAPAAVLAILALPLPAVLRLGWRPGSIPVTREQL